MIKKTYLVDDEPDCLVAIEALLRQNGTQCVGLANRAMKALRQIPRMKPDLVFLDLVMPGLTGLECARQFKSKAPGLQIFLMSGVPDPQAAYAAKLAGASGYLLKPLLADEIRAVLQFVAESPRPALRSDPTATRPSPQAGDSPFAAAVVKPPRLSISAGDFTEVQAQSPTGAIPNAGLSADNPAAWGIPQFYVSPRLTIQTNAAEGFDPQVYPRFLTKRFFQIWSEAETRTSFWLEIAQKHHFCVKELAQAFGISTHQLAREWSHCFGLEPKQWLMARRRARCQQWIDQGIDLADLAARCGYASASHLYQDKDLRAILLNKASVPLAHD